jgi:hypothetical protein
MKNVSNTYGYYLTEDSETIELRGTFKENFIYLPTKDPKEQLNYKVFVSPKKNVNFAIQIVGGDNPQNIYIPQHIYKDLDFAYYENNPYYVIKDITVVKLDFTDAGNKLITYLKTKFEKATDGVSKLSQAGVDLVDNYAGFSTSGQPIDEDILKQILFLFDEQNDIIFVDKNVKLVDETIVKERNYKSTRIKGNFTYTSNYFDSAGKFNEGILNSKSNIKLETTTGVSVSQLNDFVKDFAGSSLTEINSIYKTNIVKDTIVANAPKILGLVMSGIQQVAPLVKGTLDKVAQFNKQNATKKLEEAKALGGSLKGQLAGGVSGIKGQLAGGVSGIKGQATDAVDNIKGLFSTSKSLVSKYQSSVMLPPTTSKAGVSNAFSIAKTGASNVSNTVKLGKTGVSNAISVGKATAAGASNAISVGKAGVSNASNAISIGAGKLNSVKTISTIGNVSLAEGQQMIKNAAKSTPSSIKQINADFLKF